MNDLTIAIGVGVPLSGVAAPLGVEVKQAVQLAVDERNASRHDTQPVVTTIVRDDKDNPSRGVSIARQFVDDRRICGVVGHYASDVTTAATECYDAARLAVIAPIASNPRLTERGYTRLFRLTNRDDSTAAAIAGHLYHRIGKRRAAVVESRTAYGRSMSECFTAAFNDMEGAVVGTITVDEGQRDFASVVRALPRDADMVFYGGSFEGAPLLRALRDAGIGDLFAAGDGCWDVPNFLQPTLGAAEAGEGVLVLSASLPADHSGRPSEVANRYAARFGPIGNYALNAYDAARALLAAIDDAARQTGLVPERETVATALSHGGLDGVAFPGRLDWDVKRDNLSAVTVLHVVRNGRFEAVAASGREHRLAVGLDNALPPPMQMGDPAGNDFRGYEVDLLEEIATRLNVEIRYRRAPWSRLVDDLERGVVDVICSAATITDDRGSRVDFSRPYLPVPLAIVSRTDTSATSLHDVAVLAVRRETTAERYIRRYGRQIGLVSESNDELYEALIAGRVDAVIDDMPIAGAFARRLPNLHVSRLPDTDSAYALLLRKGNRELQARINAVLADIESNGTLTRLQERWQVDGRD
jgi:branched-chain amino acid transport system substrate-binding protein